MYQANAYVIDTTLRISCVVVKDEKKPPKTVVEELEQNAYNYSSGSGAFSTAFLALHTILIVIFLVIVGVV